MGNEIVKQETREIVTVDELDMQEMLRLTGLDELNPEDIALPILAIKQAQGTWGEDAQIGKIVNRLSGDAAETVEAIPVWVKRTRIMWQQPFENNRIPLCASDDGNRPRNDRVVAREPGPCNGCPMAEWGNESDEHTPPPCSATWNILLYMPETDDVALARMARTSYKSGSNIVNYFIQNLLKRGIVLGTEPASDGGKKWYVWKFTAGTLLDNATRVAALAKLRNIQPLLSIMTAEMGNVYDDAAAAAEGDDDFAPAAAGDEEPLAF